MNPEFLGAILLLPYNFVPQGYAACEGELFKIKDEEALFTVIGTQYGEGKKQFAVPDLTKDKPIDETAYVIATQGISPRK
jgi:microcystin-dependent protein